MKRAGFTMIELIFVIVILGILAAVAIPKLAATRDDAKVSSVVGNARTLLGDMTAFYTSQGENRWNGTGGATQATFAEVTNVPTETACGTTTPVATAVTAAVVLCDNRVAGGNACLTFDANQTHITITSNATGTVCTQVANDPAVLAMVAEPIQLGGVGVVR